MIRSLALLAGALLFVAACPGNGPTDDGGTDPDKDLATVTDGGATVEMGPELVLCTGAGCIGGPCTAASECTEGTGTTKICWKNLLDRSNFVEMPNGYCTQQCTSNTDCGTGYCFAPEGEAKPKYCMARCRNASTCRHGPGTTGKDLFYACTFEGTTGKDGICFPSANLDCKPSTGSCGTAVIDQNGTTAKTGACIRAAFEDVGVCHVACQVGTQTCPKDFRFGDNTQATPQHCVFLDTTVDSAGRPSPGGDKWKGPVCLANVTPPKAAGERCTFWDECADGYQCDRFDPSADKQVCRRLCAQKVDTPTPDPNIDQFTGAVLFGQTCDPPATGTCVNALRGGTAMGTAGLCKQQP